jgi:hypothetical protein
VDERTSRSQGRNSGYREWDVCTELSGTVETSTRRGLTGRVIEGIRRPPKAREMRDGGVGGGHSTSDGKDNITLPEGRASTSVMFSIKEALRDCESSKHAIRQGASTATKAIPGSQDESEA